jgi:hypothetical protein
MATLIICDRCNNRELIKKNIYVVNVPIMINGKIDYMTRDLCIECISSLAEFMKPLTKVAKG